MSEKSVFQTLNAINVNGHTEKKNGLTYLPWAWAWGEVKKAYPDASYTIYENAVGLNYHTDGRTAWVKTGVTIDGLELIEYLPVMDMKNKSIPLNAITSFEVNKAIQRSLTKACARHGLGLYVYAGEDLPEEEAEQVKATRAKVTKKVEPQAEVIPGKTLDERVKNCKDTQQLLSIYDSLDSEAQILYGPLFTERKLQLKQSQLC